jgi:hypothetical protein
MFRLEVAHAYLGASSSSAKPRHPGLCAIALPSPSPTRCTPLVTQDPPQPLSLHAFAHSFRHTWGVPLPAPSAQSSLAAVFCTTSHQLHSTIFRRPLFSYSYALFCTAQFANSSAFKDLRTLCRKHPGWGTLPIQNLTSTLPPLIYGIIPPHRGTQPSGLTTGRNPFRIRGGFSD